MAWLERIRNKPHQEKVRLIKIILVFCFIFLLAFWFVSAKLAGKVTERSIFEAIDNNINFENTNQGNE
jgi:hypothetical protein